MNQRGALKTLHIIYKAVLHKAVHFMFVQEDGQVEQLEVMGYQKISFDEDGQNVDAHGVLSQNQGGKKISPWPTANRPAGAKVIWPIASWNER